MIDSGKLEIGNPETDKRTRLGVEMVQQAFALKEELVPLLTDKVVEIAMRISRIRNLHLSKVAVVHQLMKGLGYACEYQYFNSVGLSMWERVMTGLSLLYLGAGLPKSARKMLEASADLLDAEKAAVGVQGVVSKLFDSPAIVAEFERSMEAEVLVPLHNSLYPSSQSTQS